MKKIIALCLSLGVLISISACGSSNKIEDKAIDAYLAAITKFSEVKSTEFTGNFNMGVMGQQFDFGFHGGYLMKDEKLDASMAFDVKAGEQELKNFMEIYYTKDTLYMKDTSGKKQKVALKTLLSTMNLPELTTDSMKGLLDSNITKEDTKKQLTKATIKGNNISFVYDVKKLNENMTEASKLSTANPLVGSEALKGINISKATADISLKDGYLGKMTMDITLDTSALKTESTTSTVPSEMKIKVEFEFKNINQVKNITLPDLKAYTALDTTV